MHDPLFQMMIFNEGFIDIFVLSGIFFSKVETSVTLKKVSFF